MNHELRMLAKTFFYKIACFLVLIVRNAILTMCTVRWEEPKSEFKGCTPIGSEKT